MQALIPSQPFHFPRLQVIRPGRLVLALLSSLCVFSEASASMLVPTDLTPVVYDVKHGDADDFGKRAPPIEVPPVVHGDVVYVVIHFAFESGATQNGGYLEAQDRATGKKLWGVQVYTTVIDENGTSEQDVFIREMKLDPKESRLLVKDEAGRSYTVDIKTRQVTPLQPSKTTAAEDPSKAQK